MHGDVTRVTVTMSDDDTLGGICRHRDMVMDDSGRTIDTLGMRHDDNEDDATRVIPHVLRINAR